MSQSSTDTSVIINGKNGFTDHNGKFTEVTKDQWGFINKEGKVVIPPIYHEVYDFSEGLAVVEIDDKTKVIDKTGKVVLHLDDYHADRYSEYFINGLLKVNARYDETGFIDKTGKVVIPTKYNCVGDFSEGLVHVRTDNFGYLDTHGNIAIPLIYDWAEDFKQDFAIVESKRDKQGYIDKTGNQITPMKYDIAFHFSEGFAMVKLNDKYGFIDTTGTEVIPLIYDSANSFSEGLAEVKRNDKYGFIDTTGTEVVPVKYDKVDDFSEGLASVKLNGKYGFIDTTGHEVIPLIYDSGDDFSEGLASVMLNDKWIFIDATGKEIIPLIYEHVSSFNNGLARVRLNGKSGFIDKTGKKVVAVKYDILHDFSDGLARFLLDDKWGFVDSTGKEVIPPQFDKLGDFHQGMAKVLLNGKDGFANMLRYIREFELPTMTATEQELQAYQQEKQQFLQSEFWQEVLSNKYYQPFIRTIDSNFDSFPAEGMFFGVEFEEYFKWVALQDFISASDVDNFNLLNILKPITNFYFFLGSDCETLLQKFVNSDYAQTVEILRVGRSSFGGGYHEHEYTKLATILATGHYPQLQDFELGCWQLYSNSHGYFGNVGCVDKLLTTMPNLKRLGLFGKFTVEKPFNLPQLEHLEISVKGELGSQTEQISQEILDNILNSSLSQLKTLRINLGDFSYGKEDFIRYSLLMAFCSGQSCPQLEELCIRGDFIKNEKFIIDCCNGKIFPNLKKITYAKSLYNLGIKKLKKSEFVKANDVKIWQR